MFKSKQWICNLIALIILLTGMCTCEVKADPVFVCPQTAAITGAEAADSVLTEVGVEPTELLCTRNSTTSSQIVAQITNSRRTIKLSVVFLCVAIFSFLYANFYAVEGVVEYLQPGARTVVVNYIHNTDGKK